MFVDTHTSNGADYQHTMTLITSQLDKMNPVLADFTRTTLNPYLFKEMEVANYPMVPYMNTKNEAPDDGIIDYLETPRYSTGYTNLFNTISYVTEAHMLKPYPERVEATYTFLSQLISFMDSNEKSLQNLKLKALENQLSQKYLAINWELDTTKFDSIPFKGYTARYKKSEVTGNERLYYDRSSPYEKEIRYYNRYKAIDSVSVPYYYIIPQAWIEVIELLSQNKVEMFSLVGPLTLEVEVYEISDYQTRNSPYEGHYLHSNIQTNSKVIQKKFRQNDVVIPVRNKNMRFIMETLEPRAVDSYFAWNYFDAILQQKEWFSAYVFEDEAAEMLKNDPDLKDDFEKLKLADSTFAKSDFAQLYYLYKRSANYESTFNQFPIARVISEQPNLVILR